MQIGEVAERVELSLRTIRFYEEAGLVIPAARSTGGFRLYAEADVDRLALIKKMKPLGLSVEEIGDVLTLLDALAGRTDVERDRAALLEDLSSYHEIVEQRIARLQSRLDAARGLSEQLQRTIEHG